ncbi:MAG: PIG-L family deacetylase [Oscillospiraceae bacterium]|nr:PIG-L family deacetylase [Oscillospiraceae bacterium]
MKKLTEKKLKILWIAAALLLLTAAALILNGYSAHRVAPLRQEVLDGLDLSQTDKLMIVAHPDDETIWGGAHLLDGGYLVVCITNGRNRTRAAEFRSAVEKTGNIPLILEYPDKVNFIRDNWNRVRGGIEDDLKKVIALKKWSLIVTHNPKGEYGHIHHKMTNALTVRAYDDMQCEAELYVFGDYYKAADLPAVKEKLETVGDEALRKKKEICAGYASQKDVMDKLCHMFPYENWVLYAECNRKDAA